jgi:1,2-diacylglycerol-3-alpha-glucose alpha-1,2-glucosyltransferase
MKVCLYGELGGILKGSGIFTAIDHQEKALKLNGVEVTRDANDDFDLIDINTVGPRSAYVAHKMRWNGMPVVIHSHTTVEDFRESFRFSTKIAPRLKSYLRYFYAQADMIVSPSEYTKGVLRDYGLKRTIEVISNGVDSDNFKPKEKLRRQFRKEYELEGLVPYSVGHIFKRKGVLEFMDLAKYFPQTKFMWVGRNYRGFVDGDIRGAIQRKPDNVMFTGYVKEVVGAYCAGDIFLFPSWCENQGISILEAASCGKPLIVRDLPTYDGWLLDGKNCLKARDNVEFARHLSALMDDERLRTRLGEKARKMSREHSLRKVGSQLKHAYERLLEK